MLFIDLGLSSELCLNVSNLGYEEPTPVQVASIPKALAGTDLLVGAQTGTGKTAAFALPILDNLLMGETKRLPLPKKPIALVLTPTRELAHQVHESFRGYGAGLGLKSTVVFGGANMERQIQALRRGTHVLVATPGRLIDHMMQKKISLANIEYLVLDEADRMLDMGFLPALNQIVDALPKERQTWLFSATFAPEIKKIAESFMTDAVQVQIAEENSIATTIRHRFHPVNPSRKRQMLVHMLAEKIDEQALIFCRTKNGCDRLTKYLRTGGFQADTIHGNKTQPARLRALKKFKDGQVTILVATDIAARGLDIQQLPRVINYDLPMVPSDYIHRIGRTGRAGSEGEAISIVSSDQMDLFDAIQRMLGQPVETGSLEGFDAGTTVDLSQSRSNRARSSSVGRVGSYGTKRGSNRPANRNFSDRKSRPNRAGGDSRASRGSASYGEKRERRAVGSVPKRNHLDQARAWVESRMNPSSDSGPTTRDNSRSDSRPKPRDSQGPGYRRDSRSDSRPSYRGDSRSDSRPSYRGDSRSDSRPSYRGDSRSDSRPSYRGNSRSDSRPSYRSDSRSDSRPSYRSDSRSDSRPSYRSDSRSDSRPSYRSDSGSDSRPSYRSDSRSDSRPSYRSDSRSDSRPSYRGNSRTDSRPSYRSDSRSDSRPSYRSDSRSDSRPSYRGNSRSDSRPSYRDNSRSDSRPAYRGDSRSDSRPSHRSQSGSDSRPSYRGDSRFDSRPGAGRKPRGDSYSDTRSGAPSRSPQSRHSGGSGASRPRQWEHGRPGERRSNDRRSPEGRSGRQGKGLSGGGWGAPKSRDARRRPSRPEHAPTRTAD